MSEKLMNQIKKILGDISDKALHFKKRYLRANKYHKSRHKKVINSAPLNKEQEKQIDDFYLKNYGHKIPYIYHQYATAFTGNFDVQYFPDCCYGAEFNHYMHYDRAYNKVLADKNLLDCFASKVGVKTPRTLLSRAAGVFRDENNHILSREAFENKFAGIGEVFAKASIDSAGGASCLLLNMAKGVDQISGKTVAAIIKKMGYDFVVQEKLNCDKTLSAIYPNSANTFRVITYLWKDKIYHCPLALRIGQGGSCVDNACAGGMFIAVDDDGTLHDMAFTEYNAQYKEHPDTHFVFKGHKIPQVEQIISYAYKLHELLPQIGFAHWDFTLDKEGNPVLLEANLREGSYWLSQLPHGKGLFGKNTAEILQWISKMKKLSYTERKFYRYGYMEKQ